MSSLSEFFKKKKQDKDYSSIHALYPKTALHKNNTQKINKIIANCEEIEKVVEDYGSEIIVSEKKKYFLKDKLHLRKLLQRIKHNIYFDDCANVLKTLEITHRNKQPTGEDLKERVFLEIKEIAENGFHKEQLIRMKCPCFILYTGTYLHDGHIYFSPLSACVDFSSCT